MARFYCRGKRAFFILFINALLCAFNSFGQTPIPGHLSGITNGTGGALLNQPRGVFISGNYAFVASRSSNALEIIDITDPASPVHKSSLTVNGANSVFVSGNYAFITCGSGSDALQIIDVSDPSSPSLAGSLIDGTGGALLANPVSVYVSGSYAYVASAGANALEIIDVSDPSSPAHAGSLDNSGGVNLTSPSSVFVSGTNAYVASSADNALEIVDVSTPTAPVHNGVITDGSGGALLSGPTSVFVSGSFAFVVSQGSDALEIVDVSDPANPVHQGSTGNGSGGAALLNPESVFVSGNYCYIASGGSNALEIIDITDTTTPVHAAKLLSGTNGALLSSPQSVYTSGNYAYVVSGGNTFEVVSIFSPVKPTATAATLIGQTQFQANWNAVGNASGYFIDVATDAGFTSFVSGFNNHSVASTSTTVTGLTGGITYYYRIRSTNANSTSGNSSTISVLTIPATPTASAASSVGQTSFTANWSTVSGATSYNLDVATDSGFTSFVSGFNNLSTTSTSAPITGLASGTTYYYRVRSVNATGTSPYSSTVSQITIPADPTATAATGVGQTSFTANWSADTGATGYLLDVAADAAFSSFVSGYNNLAVASTSSSVTGLTTGTTYYYRVQATNAGGTSGNSSTISTITIPAAPTANAASSVTQTSFSANWSASTGASGYFLDIATDAAFTSFVTGFNNLSVASTSSSVTGLTAGTTYYYRMRATNAGGTSGNSSTISATTIPTAPTANAASSITQTSFTANWSSSTGATGYFLDVATDVGFTSFVTGFNSLSVASTSSSVAGLTAGSTYYYRVRAADTGGTSGNSSVITVTVLPATPGAPTANVATSITETDFIANWSSSAGATSYFLDVATNVSFTSFVTGFNNLSVASTSASVTGLTGGTTYYYRVRATNAGGTSGNSSTISVLTIPAEPTANAASLITATSFTANWSATAGATGYFLDVATDAGFTSLVTGYNNLSVASTSSAVMGLTAGTPYYYQVRAKNATGTSGNSSTISVTTIPPAPTANAGTSVTQTSFTANWSASLGATGYFLDVSTNGGYSSFVPGYNNLSVASTSVSVTGLTAGANYHYRVRATNSSGTSGNSSSITVGTLPATPPAPVANTATAIAQTSFTANWSAATGATGYFLDVATDAGFTSFVSGYNNLSVATTFSSVTGLTAGTTYYYQVRATNAGGTSGNSTTISAITIPATPTSNAATSIAQTSFTANWSSSTGASGYFLDVATDAGFTSFVPGYNNLSVASTSSSVTGLSGGTIYYYRVRATDAGGTSGNSSTASVLTLPAAPVATAATAVTQTSFTANWNSVTSASSYELDVATDAAFSSFVSGYNGLSAASTSSSVTGLAAGTTYYYRVNAVNATGNSVSSNTVSEITISANPVASAASAIGQTSFTANWNSSTGASGYFLDVATDAAFSSLVSGYNSLSVASTSSPVTGLAGGTTYYYRVRATNAGGTSGNSSTISLITIPPAPVSNTATSITPTSFTANWSASTGATAYFLDVATDAAFSSFVTGFNNLSVASTSSSVNGLTAGTTYYYRVRATNVSGTSGNSSTIIEITLPSVPTASAATAITQTSFTANWSTVTGAAGYLLDVATDASFTSFVTGYNNLSVAATSSSVSGLVGGTTYYYRVRATNGSGASGNSSTIIVLTVPAAPSVSAATAVTQTSFTANWASSTGATSYFLDVATDNLFSSFVSGYNNLSVASTSSLVTGLTAGVNYYYRVRAVNVSGTSANSSTISTLTIPTTPIANAATSVTQTSFIANWSTVSGATSYNIDVATDAAFSSFVSGYDNLSVASASTTISGLSSGVTYYYQVRATNGTGSTGSSNTISQITIPANPTSAAASSIGQTTFTANWNSVMGATGYAIDVSASNTFSSFVTGYQNLSVGNVTNYIVNSGLSGSTTYYYRIRSVNAGGTSGNSAVMSLLTLSGTPVASAATSITQTSFVANWSSVSGASSYELDVATDAAFSSFVTGYNGLSVAGISSSVTGLSSGTTYYYRVNSVNASGSSPSSNTISQITTPANPTATGASAVGVTSFTANWSSSIGASGYFLDVATDAAFASILSGYNNLPVSTTSQVVSGLTSGITYYYRVRATDAGGTSGNSSSILVATIPAAPNANAATSITQTSFTANWSASTGATGYFLDVSTSNTFLTFVTGYQNLSLGNVTSYSVNSNISTATTYYYRVRASNASGSSSSSSAITVLTEPATPTANAASSITQTGFTASWNAITGAISYELDVATDPSFSSFVTGYNSLSIASTNSAVTGLSPGATYYYRVRSADATGASPSSNTITVVTVPANPVASAASTIGQNSFTANWSAIAGASNYFLDVATDVSFSSILSSYNNLSVSFTFSSVNGLAAGTTYYYRVRAANASGTSGNSSAISVSTIPPGPVSGAATNIGETSFTANWATTTGASGYFLDVSPNSSFSSFVAGYNNLLVATNSASVTGLMGGTTYYYRVRATNSGGTSGNSSTINVTTVPDSPTAASASSVTQTSFTANWSSVTGATSYGIDVATDATFTSFVTGYNNVSVVSTSLAVTGLASGVTYYYRVRSADASGSSNSSNTISQITIPSNPTPSVASSITQASFIANWNSVTGATGYFLDVATDASFTSILSGYNNLSVAATSSSVTGLSSGTIYYYRVRATNAGGTSGNSANTSVTTVPAAPVASAASTVSQTGFTANWNSVSGATGYFLDVASDVSFSSILSGYNNLAVASTASAVTGLTAGTTYYYRVRATNANGTTGNSSTISVITVPLVPIANAGSSITQTSFVANWASSTGASGYYLDVAIDASFSSFVSGYNNLSVATTSTTVSGLTGGVTYYYRVRATNSGGTSGNSSTILVATVPGSLVAIAASSVSQNSFVANWSTVIGATSYELDVSANAAFSSFVSGYNSLSVVTNSASVTGLSSGVTYYYRVRSVNGSGSSPSSNTISQITIPADPAVSAASSITQTSFTANWTASTGATGYYVDVATDAAFNSILTNYNNLSVVSTTTSVTGLSGGTVYYYRVRASNAGGTSGNTSMTSLLTISSNPVAVAASSITQTGFVANWNSVTGASSYSIDVATDSGFSSMVSGYNNLTVVSNSLAITGLSSGVTYYYRIRSMNATGGSSSSNTISQITIAANPVASSATSITETSFVANWSASTGAGSYQLDVATDAGFASILSSYNGLSVSGTSSSVVGLTGGTNYYYRVRSVNGGGNSGNSSPSIVALTVPSAPVASAATSIGQTNFDANWASSPGTTSYSIDVSTSNTFSTFVTGYQNFSVGNVTSYTVNSNLSAGKTYYYRVRASNASGTSVNSSIISLLTLPATPNATAPTSISQNSFVANWSSVAGATSYSIDVAADNAFSSLVYNNVNVGTATSYTASSLSSGTTYYYHVRSNNATGSSPSSNVVTATTLSLANTQASNLTFSTVTTTSIKMSFTVGDGTARLVLVKAGAPSSVNPTNGVTYSASATFGNGSPIGSGFVVANGAASTVTVTGLAVNTVYYFQVFEYTGSGGTEIYNTSVATNNPASQTTLATQPTIQAKNVSFNTIGSSSVNVNFTSGNGSSRVLIARAGTAVNSIPVDGVSYTADAFGNGSELGVGNFVVGIGPGPITVTGLSPATQYYFQVFEFNGSGGSENYNVTTVANQGNVTTLSASPTTQSSEITFVSLGSNSVTLNFTPGDGASHLLVASANAPLNTFPADAASYNSPNLQFGQGTALGTGYVISTGAGPITITGLTTSAFYYFQIFDFNGSGGTENYLTSTAMNNPVSIATLATPPTAQPTSITFSQQTGTSVAVSFQPANPAPTGYIALRAVGAAPNTDPVSGNFYNVGDAIGNAKVANVGALTSFNETNLPTAKQYFYKIYSFNGSGVFSNYLTASPAQSNVILDVNAPVISFPVANPTTVTAGSTITLSANVVDNFHVASVQLFHRGITQSTFKSETILSSNNTYSMQSQTSWYDSLGIEYYFIATDENGNATTKPTVTHFVKLTQPSVTFSIPSDKGHGSRDYRIVSFPYNLSPNNDVASVFPGVATKDQSKFRLLHYNPFSKKYDEYAKDEFSEVDLGKGYWILTSDVTSVTVNNATVPSFDRSHLDSIVLQPGWNEIGNPYPAEIKWGYVQSFTGQPTGTDTLSLYVYNNGWAKLKSTEKLEPFSGGFVKNPSSAPMKIYIPFQGQTTKGGRTDSVEPGSDISQQSWQVDLNIAQAGDENRIGGMGMDTRAYYGMDRFDSSNPPGFNGSPQLSFIQSEVKVNELARSVVPTQSEYTWKFTATGEIGEPAELVWNSDLGQGDEKLYLLDEQFMQVVDMRAQQKYSFVLHEGHTFKIFFGTEAKVATDDIMLSQPYPNPAVDRKTNFTLGLPQSGNYMVNFQIFNSSGDAVLSDSKNLAGGIQQLEWNALDNISSGLYLYRITVSDGNKNIVSTGKIIIP